MNKTQIAAVSLVHVYTFGSECLDRAVLFQSVLWMCETGSCTMIWNIPLASAAGTELVLYVPSCKCVSPDA